MITSAAQTESLISEAIAGCLGVDFEYGGAVTTHISVPLKFSILRSVAEIRIDDLDVLDELDVLLDAIEESLTKRNSIAHHQFMRDPSTEEVFAVKETSRTRYEMKLVPVSIDDIKRDALLVYNLGMALMTFLGMHGLRPEIPSSLRPRHHKSKAARKKRREIK